MTIMKKNLKTILSLSALAAVLSFSNVGLLNAQNLKDGLKLIERERFDDAKLFFKNYIDKNQSSADAYYYLGEAYFTDTEYDSASIYYQKGSLANPKDPKNFVALGKVALIKKDSLGAVQLFQKASKIADDLERQDVADVNLLIANAYISSSADFSAAKRYLDQAKSLDSLLVAKAKKRDNRRQDPRILLSYGDLYVKMNDWGKASDYYFNTIYRDNSLTAAYIGYAHVLIKTNNFQEAEDSIKSVIKRDPTYSTIYRELGDLYYSTKKLPEAIEAYKKYAELSGNKVKTLRKVANALYLTKNYDQVIGTLNEALKDNPNNVDFLKMIAWSYSSKIDQMTTAPAATDFSLAKSAYDKYFSAAKASDLTSTDYLLFAQLLHKSANDSAAIAYYHKALEKDTLGYSIHGELATLYFQKKDYKNAISQYLLKEKKMGKNMFPLDYFYLGLSYFITKDYSNAEKAFGKTTEIVPNMIQAHYWRASALSQSDPELLKGTARPSYEAVVKLFESEQAQDQAKNKKIAIDSYTYLKSYYEVHITEPDAKANIVKVLSSLKKLESDPDRVKAIDNELQKYAR